MWLDLWLDRLVQLWVTQDHFFWCPLCWELRVALYKHKFTVVVEGVLHAT